MVASPLQAQLVSARGLTRAYRMGRAEVRALDGVDLDVEAGGFVAIVGVSGSGKSTFLHLAGGLDTPTAGRLLVDGRDVGAMDRRARTVHRRETVGFVFQSFYLVPSLTAAANVALALTFRGTWGAQRETRTRAVLDRVGLAERAGHRPGELSGGEQQRVAIARAIVHRPRLLLADEPTGNLDHATGAGVIALLRELNRDLGTTVLMVTHDEETARRSADRVVRLRDGRRVAEGEA